MQPFGDGLFVSCRCPAAPGVVVSDCPWCLLPPFWVRWQRAESIFAGGPAQGRRPRPLGWTAYDAAPSWGLWPCMARHEQHTAFIIFFIIIFGAPSLMAWRSAAPHVSHLRLRYTEHPTKVIIYLQATDRPQPAIASAVSSGGARGSWQADSPAIARVARRCIDDGDEADPGPGGWLALACCWCLAVVVCVQELLTS